MRATFSFKILLLLSINIFLTVSCSKCDISGNDCVPFNTDYTQCVDGLNVSKDEFCCNNVKEVLESSSTVLAGGIDCIIDWN